MFELAILGTVGSDCSFFTDHVYEALRKEMIISSEGVPNESRLGSSFSVYTFLRMQPGLSTDTLLPADG